MFILGEMKLAWNLSVFGVNAPSERVVTRIRNLAIKLSAQDVLEVNQLSRTKILAKAFYYNPGQHLANVIMYWSNNIDIARSPSKSIFSNSMSQILNIATKPTSSSHPYCFPKSRRSITFACKTF